MPRVRSKRSGRALGDVDVKSAWLVPTDARLHQYKEAVIPSLDSPNAIGEVEFAIMWARNWLMGYVAGWCPLESVIDATTRGASRLPLPYSEMLVGIVATRALRAEPRRRLGEHKSRTPPHLVFALGEAVQSRLFDAEGNQRGITVGEAVDAVHQLIQEMELLAEVPSTQLLKTWFQEWRRREKASGREVLAPRAGRPPSSSK